MKAAYQLPQSSILTTIIAMKTRHKDIHLSNTQDRRHIQDMKPVKVIYFYIEHELFHFTVARVNLGSIVCRIDADGLTAPMFKWAAAEATKADPAAGGLIAVKRHHKRTLIKDGYNNFQ